MGCVLQFSRALNRAPLQKWARFPGASGPHKGLGEEAWVKAGRRMPWEVVALAASSDDPCSAYVAASTILDVDDVLELLDVITEVQDSWKHAALWNQSNG